jgi:hypothetical protein
VVAATGASYPPISPSSIPSRRLHNPLSETLWPFFANVGRDGAMVFLKAGEAEALPNPKRDRTMRWDAYCYTPDPDALAAEFSKRGAPFSKPLEETADGLRGFEVADPDGYVLFFGRPR